MSGMAMTFVVHTDVVAVKAFFLGLMTFELRPLPADPLLLVHLFLVALLMIIFPYQQAAARAWACSSARPAIRSTIRATSPHRAWANEARAVLIPVRVR